jgi:DNA-binding transcriptional ArsR family regulator
MDGMGLYHPPREDLELAAVLHALSDPQRLQVVRELSLDPTPRPCGSFELGVSKSTCTHHFRVLREAGVITQHALGTSKLTALRRDDLDERFPGLLDAVLGSVALHA